jgi:hypothetical protein
MADERHAPVKQPKRPGAPQSAPAPLLGTEDMLLGYVDQLASLRNGQRAMIVHLSRLQGVKPRDKHLQIVANVLRQLTDQYSGRLFVLGNGDVVLLCKGITRRAIDETIEVLRYLFNDDPVTREGAERADFCAVFDLEVGYVQFRFALDEIREASRRSAAAGPRLPRLDPASIAGVRAGDLLKALNRLDLASLVRRETIWEMAPKAAPRAMFDEIFVSMEQMQKALGPNFDLVKDRPLSLYVKQWLDRRLMETLVRHKANVAPPLSVNLNLSTLQSPDFDEFDGGRPAERERVILEMPLAELWSTPSTFRAVADLLKRRGYRRSLDGVSHQMLPYLNLGRLALDYVKVVWDDALLHLGDGPLREFCEAIAACGSARIILSHCGRRQAISVGHAMGIRLFQGWQVDQANQG